MRQILSQCDSCGTFKSRSMFDKHARSSNGLMNICKVCREKRRNKKQA